jgi:predicted transcriptional regulator
VSIDFKPQPNEDDDVQADAEADDVEMEEDPTAASAPRFREAAEAASLGDIFQEVDQLLPDDQELLSFTAGMSSLEALRVLGRHGYSQAPVLSGGRCIGMFSYRSFARAVAAFPEAKTAAGAIAVEDCLEQIPFVGLRDKIEEIFDGLDRHDVVLVGDRDRVLAIVTPMDALYYLYGIANGYVLMRQIELALRHVVRLSTNGDTLSECIAEAIAQKYEAQRRRVPERLEDMDFSDLGALIVSGRTWPHFTRVLGENLDLVKTRLGPLGGIRNDLFHFRRSVTAEEYEMLAMSRNWLLLRLELAERPEAQGVA